MAFVVKDRVKETSSTTGTGAFTLSGAPTNYQTFNTAIGVGNVTWYCINNLSANEWEVGLGTLTAGTTLTRTTVVAGTNGTSAVNFSAGTKEVFVTGPASKLAVQDDAGNVTISGGLSSSQTMGRTNLVINPHGSIQQETGSAITTDGGYVADQWRCAFTAAGGAFSDSVGADYALSAYDPCYIAMKTTTAKAVLAAGDFHFIEQRIEGYYSRRLLYGVSAAKPSWVRFRASASQSCTISMALRNAAGARSFVQSFAVTTTPTEFSVFVPGDTTGTWPTTNTHAVSLTFCHAAGTTFQTATLGAWQAGNFLASNTQTNLLGTLNAQLNITDVQWAQSNVLLPFEPIDWEVEFGRCQRYWQSVGWLCSSVATAPNQDVYAQGAFMTLMRTAPSVTKLGTSVVNCTNPNPAASQQMYVQDFARASAAGPIFCTYQAQCNARM